MIEEFIEKFNSKLIERQGTITKEYVSVPNVLLPKTK